MEVEKIHQLINDGKSLLDQGRFPEEIILSIDESRLREDITKQIFKVPKHHNELTEREQKKYAERFQIKQSFESWYDNLRKTRVVGPLLFVVGFVLLVTAAIGANDNFLAGTITTVTGLILLIAGRIKELVQTQTTTVGLVYLSIVIIEVVLIGLPGPLVKSMGVDILNNSYSKYEGIAEILNAFTPVIYLLIKVLLVIPFALNFFRHRKYIRDLELFEGRSVGGYSR